MLKQAINDYLLWMIAKGYAQSSLDRSHQVLRHFSLFVDTHKIPWENIFTLDILESFQKHSGLSRVSAVRGLAKYLFKQNRINQPIQKEKYKLTGIYEEYFLNCMKNYANTNQAHRFFIQCTQKVLATLCEYLQSKQISLSNIKIEQLDAFLAEYNTPFAIKTQRRHRCILRKFLRYLYQEKGIIKRDLAPLLVSPPIFTQAKPPKFLRPHEVQKLFTSLDTSSAKGLRTCAILHLAYTLGLRPKEITLIRLDDISFSQGELTLRERKCENPIKLPLPEKTIKAIAAYIIGVRPNTDERILFLSLKPPYSPMLPSMVSNNIWVAMQRANLTGSAYWLRHTYAQNLLENGATIFEIKEMLGHDRIQSSQSYLHIHTKLMREIIFDETL